MIILGVDPGTTKTGFGIIKTEKNRLKLVDCGTIETKPKIPEAEKLLEIFQDIQKIIKKYQPDLMAVEKIFFFKNAKTAINVGQAKGIILLAAAKTKAKILEISPLQIKMAVCSDGRAEKLQIQKMVKTWLNLKEIPKPDHAADALAAAICAANMKNLQSKIQISK